MDEKRTCAVQEIMDMPWERVRYTKKRGYHCPSILYDDYPI